MFSTEQWTFEIALFLSLQWELKSSNGYNMLHIGLGPYKLTYDLDVVDIPEELGGDNLMAEMTPQKTFLYSTWL